MDRVTYTAHLRELRMLRRHITQAEKSLDEARAARSLAVTELGGYRRADPEAIAKAAGLDVSEVVALVPLLADPDDAPAAPSRSTPHRSDRDADGYLVQDVPEPCTRCGTDTEFRAQGLPQCADAKCPVPAPAPGAADPAEPSAAPEIPAAPVPAPAPSPRVDVPAGPAAHDQALLSDAGPEPESAADPTGQPAPQRRMTWGDPSELIPAAVAEAAAQSAGDTEHTMKALAKRAIPDAMTLMDTTRAQGHFTPMFHPPLPEIFYKTRNGHRSAQGASRIWEARQNWRRQTLPPGEHTVTTLDVNAAYLAAFQAHLPKGELTHRQGPIDTGELDLDPETGETKRRSGVYLIADVPAWVHDHLPHPLGAREEPGPLWITDPTLRLLQRCASDKYGRLLQMPVVLESWTGPSSESILSKMRQLLRDARADALANGDPVTEFYVKQIYSKFVSTLGESPNNRAIERIDWFNIIHSQAYSNLWTRAFKAHSQGLTVVRLAGTDELHVIGNWRPVFGEGRALNEMKVKTDDDGKPMTYTVTKGT